MQALLPPFRRVPRPAFTIVVFIIYTVIGVIGREHITDILNNFLAIVNPPFSLLSRFLDDFSFCDGDS